MGENWQYRFSIKTALADQNPDPIRAKEVIERSRMNYGCLQPNANNGKSVPWKDDDLGDDKPWCTDDDNLDLTAQVF